MMTRKLDALFIGPFPDPVHGQSLATARLFDLLVESGLNVRAVDTGEGSAGNIGKMRRLVRLALSLVAAFRSSNWLYLSANSGMGLIFSSLQARIGRALGKKIIVHHHVYRYIGEFDARMQRLAVSAGSDAVHLTNCDRMAELLRERYPVIGRCIGYGNAGFVDEALTALPLSPATGGTITLGHMSNLSVDKGTGRVVDIFTAARQAGLPVRLLLAGPFADKRSADIVADATRQFPGDVAYLGPVYGADKTAFFDRSDIFLFPTEYKNEAGPIVLLEAMAAGIPCVSTEQCCIPSMLAAGGGLALKAGAEDATEKTVGFIARYAENPGEHAQIARSRFHALLEEQKEKERALVTLIDS